MAWPFFAVCWIMVGDTMFSIEPTKYPIKRFSYYCDNRYHIELVEDLFDEGKDYGLLVISGTGCKFYKVSGDGKKVCQCVKIGEKKVRLPKSQKKGGQSAQRIGRIRKGDIQKYLDDVVYDMQKIYLNSDGLLNVSGGLFIAGYGGKQKEILGRMERVKELRDGVLDIFVCSERDVIDDILCKVGISMKREEFSEEIKELDEWCHELDRDTGLVEYGEVEVKGAFKDGYLRKLFINTECMAITDVVLERIRGRAKGMGCKVVVVPFEGKVNGMGDYLGLKWMV